VRGNEALYSGKGRKKGPQFRGTQEMTKYCKGKLGGKRKRVNARFYWGGYQQGGTPVNETPFRLLTKFSKKMGSSKSLYLVLVEKDKKVPK